MATHKCNINHIGSAVLQLQVKNFAQLKMIPCISTMQIKILTRPVEIKKTFWGGRGWGGSLSKNVGRLGQLSRKIVQLKSFIMPSNT